MSNYLIIRHNVRDFQSWKPGYDSHLAAREIAGLKEMHVLRGVDDPNDVTLIFKAADLDKAKAFIDSPDLKAVMQDFGVIGIPEIRILHEKSTVGVSA